MKTNLSLDNYLEVMMDMGLTFLFFGINHMEYWWMFQGDKF